MTAQVINRFLQPRIDGAASTSLTGSYWLSSWKYEGSPGHNAAPAAIAVPTNTTGLKQNNAPAGKELWLASINALSLAQTISLVLSDRLLHVGGLSGTSTSLQNFAGGAVTYVNRDPTLEADGLGIGNELWVEISLLIGSATATLTINYRDADDVARVATRLIGSTGQREAGILLPVTLANDRGVKGLTSCQLDVTTGTVGDIAIVVGHRLAPALNVSISTAFAMLAVDQGFARVLANACLWDHWLQSGSFTAGNLVLHAQYALVDR